MNQNQPRHTIYFCDTPTCYVSSFTKPHGLRGLPCCPVCGDLGDSLDENGNPPSSEVSQ